MYVHIYTSVGEYGSTLCWDSTDCFVFRSALVKKELLKLRQSRVNFNYSLDESCKAMNN